MTSIEQVLLKEHSVVASPIRREESKRGVVSSAKQHEIKPLGKHLHVSFNIHHGNLVNPLAKFNNELSEGVTEAYSLLSETNQVRRELLLQRAAYFINRGFPDLSSLFKEIRGAGDEVGEDETPTDGEERKARDEVVGMVMPIQSILEGGDIDRQLNESTAGLLVLA